MKDLSRKIISVLAGIIVFIIITQILVLFPILAHAETEISFTPDIKFEIPSNNSSISFASNGTYEMAILENRTWSFNNLHFITMENDRWKTT